MRRRFVSKLPAVFLVLLSLPAMADEVITNVMSPYVAYLYEEQASANNAVSSPCVTYLYFEWPGDDVLQVKSSSVVSYLYPSISGVAGHLVDATTGFAVVGATVAASGNTTNTDISGFYCITNVLPGFVLVEVSADGYTPTNQIVEVSSDGIKSGVDFRLKPLPVLTNLLITGPLVMPEASTNAYTCWGFYSDGSSSNVSPMAS
jgi:hypothetical protein